MKRLLIFISVIALLGGCIWAQAELAREREALRQLSAKAEQGDAKSIYELARIYEYGYDSIPPDSILSLALYRKAAEKEWPAALNYLGFKYFAGNGVAQNLDSAFTLIRRAAELGDITAAANLGYLLTETSDSVKNEREAAKWLTVASKAGVPEVQLKLTELMEEEWQTLPADSALNLGLEYYTGRAPIAGVPLLEIAARQGNPKAMALLADAYSKGLGVAYNHQKMIEYFYEAACLGEPSAQFIMAELLEFFPDALEDKMSENLIEDSVDKMEAFSPEYWYEKAAQNGVTDSETAYERLYSH